MENIEEFSLEITTETFNQIKEMTKKMPVDKDKIILCSVFIEYIDNKTCKAVATEGYSMNIRTIEAKSKEKFESFMIPYGLLRNIPTGTKKDYFNYIINVDVENDWITVKHKDSSFGSRMIKGKYPDYKLIIPNKDILTLPTDKICINIKILNSILLSGDYAHKLYFYGNTKPIVVKNLKEDIIGVIMPIRILEWE